MQDALVDQQADYIINQIKASGVISSKNSKVDKPTLATLRGLGLAKFWYQFEY